MKTSRSRYKRQAEKTLIEMRLNNIMQLFNSLDPSPFHEKDLDDDAEEYIVSSVREFPLNAPLKLIIHLPPDTGVDETEGSIGQAIHNYFEYKAQLAQRDFRQSLKQGRISLVIGMAFLFACLSTGEVIAGLGQTTVYRILQEGLLISGWVAMWRPIQIFLYDWWPLRNIRRVYEKLARMEIDVVHTSARRKPGPHDPHALAHRA